MCAFKIKEQKGIQEIQKKVFRIEFMPGQKASKTKLTEANKMLKRQTKKLHEPPGQS